MGFGSPEGGQDRQMQCPACRAVQPWSDTCRRCKCDLGLLRSAMAAAEESRTRCLEALRDGRWSDAVQHARQAHELSPSQETLRTLAVCHLLGEDWRLALALASQATQARRP